MQPDEAENAISQGEGQRAEFKQSFATENEAIKTLCAFANAEGGSVFFGVTNDGQFMGADLGRNTLERFATKLRASTDPPLSPSIEQLKLKGQVIVAATVQPCVLGQVVFAFGSPLVRVGKTNQLMSPEEMRIRLVRPGDPIIVKLKEEHFEDLAAIAYKVLTGRHNLIDTEENPSFGKPITSRGDVSKSEYLIIYRGGTGEGATREELSSALKWDIWEAYSYYSQWEFYTLVSHLEAENPDIKAKGFRSVVDNNPYELILTLRASAIKKIFKGKCPVCQDWP